jgi:hypothetical protein
MELNYAEAIGQYYILLTLYRAQCHQTPYNYILFMVYRWETWLLP